MGELMSNRMIKYTAATAIDTAVTALEILIAMFVISLTFCLIIEILPFFCFDRDLMVLKEVGMVMGLAGQVFCR